MRSSNPRPSVSRVSSSPGKRVSVSSAAARPQPPRVALTAPPTCFVSSDARLEGTIALGDGCVLHPRCSVIVAPGASLSLGPGCVVEENAIVRVLSGAAAVGEHTVFMVGCSVDLVGAVGAWNTFSPRCRVEGVRVGDHCTFGAGTTTTANDADRLPAIQADGKNKRAATSSNSSANFSANTSASDAQRPPKVPDRTVIYGATSAPRTWDGSGEAMEKNVRLSATEFLREVLPKSNKQRQLS